MSSHAQILKRFAVLPLVLAAGLSQLQSSAATLTVSPDWVGTDAKAFSLPGMTDTGAAAAGQVLNLMVTLKLQNTAALDAAYKHLTTPGDPLYQHYLTPKQFSDAYSPSSTQAAAVMDYLRAKGFSNVTLSPNRTQIHLTGTVAQAQAAFNTVLHNFSYQGKSVVANTLPAQIPAVFADTVRGVLGLSTVQIMHLNHPKKVANAKLATGAATPAAVGVPSTNMEYTPGQFQQIYDVGNTPNGSKVAIAIITEGDMSTVLGTTPGGSIPDIDPKKYPSDLRLAEAAHKQPVVPVTIVQTGADHTDTAGSDEWDLDTQHSTGLADNVKMLYVYDGASLSDVDIVTALNQFITDDLAIGVNESFSGCEIEEQTAGAIGAYEAAYLQMAMQGQSAFGSTGDNGSGCGTPSVGAPGGGIPGVGYPASSSNVVGVGGTNVTTNSDGSYDTETAWEGTGGGTSTLLPGGSWQSGIVPTSAAGFKGIPDVTGPAGELSSGEVYVAGTPEGVEGTSMSTPQWLGVWARLESAKVTPTNPNPLGFAPPNLYQFAVSVPAATAGATPTGFHDIIVGANGTYAATPGWDFVSGIGSYDIAALNTAMKKVSTPPVGAGTAQALGGDACLLPGNRVAAGTVGTSADSVGGQETTAVQMSHNVTAAYVSEHYTAGQVDGYTFSLDVGAVGTAPATAYFVYFLTDDGVRHYAAYEPVPDPSATNGSSYSYGHIMTTVVSAPTIGGLEDLFTPSQDGLTTGSVTATRISIFVPRSLVPTVASSKSITQIFGEVDAETGFLDTGMTDQLNALNSTDQGTFKADPAFYCFPVPVAALTVSSAKVVAGTPDTFTASSSTAAPGESVVSYSFNFGDGTSSGPQAKSSLDHTYATAGSYTTTVTVADTSGKQNANAAAVTVTVTPPPPPTAFTYAERTGVAVSTVITSESITLAGSAASYPISIVGDAGTNGQYSINGGAFTTAAGTIKPGDTLVVRQTSSSAYTTASTVTVTVGTYSTPFKVTTMDAPATPPPSTTTVDHVPAPFDFGTTTGVAPSTPTASATLTLTDYDNAPVTPGQYVSYSINGGAFTTTRGTIYKGQKLQVKMTSNANSLGYVKSYIDVGGVKGYFTIRTRK